MSYWKNLAAELEGRFGQEVTGTFLYDQPLSAHTTLGIGGPADVIYIPATAEVLSSFLGCAAEKDLPVFYLGQGSNLLVADQGYRGAVVKMSAEDHCGLKRQGEMLRVGAGALLPAIVEFAATEGLRGLEFAAGIPGSVGGAAIVNAGAYDGDMGGVVTEISGMDRQGRRASLRGEELAYRYRESLAQKSGLLVSEVVLALKQDTPARVAERVAENLKKRSSGQPLDVPSAGCVFKNPPGKEVWRLVEEAGLKGVRCGGAQVSEKHTNFIINCGGAKAADYKQLMEKVVVEVERKSGVLLEREIITLGFENDADN